MEQEITVKELIALMNDCEGDFMIQVELEEEYKWYNKNVQKI